jgi:hypothetical protein
LTKVSRASRVYLACDKSTRGKGPNKVHHYAKLASYYDEDLGEVDFSLFVPMGRMNQALIVQKQLTTPKEQNYWTPF